MFRLKDQTRAEDARRRRAVTLTTPYEVLYERARRQLLLLGFPMHAARGAVVTVLRFWTTAAWSPTGKVLTSDERRDLLLDLAAAFRVLELELEVRELAPDKRDSFAGALSVRVVYRSGQW